MMQDEQAILQNLQDAGCRPQEVEKILGFWRNGDLRQMERQIALCRCAQLDRMHEVQKCIDRLDYLSYQLEKNKERESP